MRLKAGGKLQRLRVAHFSTFPLQCEAKVLRLASKRKKKSILRKCASFISIFKSAQPSLSTLLVRAAKALLRPSSLKLGGLGHL